MAAAAAVILGSALRMDEREVQYRRARAKEMLSLIAESHAVAPVHPIAEGESGYLRLALVDIGNHRLPHPAIGVLRGYPMTLEEHPQLRPMLLTGERGGKGSDLLRDRLFTLPTHSRVNRADLTRLVKWLG
jgi:hypothetical protein